MKAIIGWVHGRLTTLFIQIFFEASVGKAIKHCCGSPVSTAGSHPSTGINAIEHFFTFYFLLFTFLQVHILVKPIFNFAGFK